MVTVTDEELKQEILESKDDLAIAIAHGVPEKRVKELRKVTEALSKVPPVQKPKEIEKEIRAAKEKREAERHAPKEKVPRFLLRDPVTNIVTELKRVNSSCDIVLLTR